ncbi:MAG: glutathione S-transferase family protein [Pseudomonadota bacterium]
MSLTLLYWDCRGRGQPLRDFFLDRAIEFDDEQLESTEGNPGWPALKADAAKTGPFGTLPVLRDGARMIVETEVIIHYLQQKFGPVRNLEDPRDLRDAMAQSAAAETRSWALAAVRGSAAAAATLTWASEKYRRLDAFVPHEQPYFGGEAPSFADYYAMEAVVDLKHVCGEQAGLFLAELPKLDALYERVRQRPGLAAGWSARPERLSGLVSEPAVLADLATVDWSSCW